MSNPISSEDILGSFHDAMAELGAQTDSLAELGKSMALTLQPVMATLAEFCDRVHRELWATYVDAGMPYGPGEEGMFQWLEEIAQVRRYLQRADYLLSRHRNMAELRKQL